MNYCRGKIEDRQVQSTTVSETQRVLLLQGNISAFCVTVQKYLCSVCVGYMQRVCTCVFFCVCLFVCGSL